MFSRAYSWILRQNLFAIGRASIGMKGSLKSDQNRLLKPSRFAAAVVSRSRAFFPSFIPSKSENSRHLNPRVPRGVPHGARGMKSPDGL